MRRTQGYRSDVIVSTPDRIRMFKVRTKHFRADGERGGNATGPNRPEQRSPSVSNGNTEEDDGKAPFLLSSL